MSASAKESSWSLALTPTWSSASVLTTFVGVSLLVERSIYWLCSWLRRTNRKPLLATVGKMKEELMLLGFISLLLTATSRTISNICIPSRFYENAFEPCSRTGSEEEREKDSLNQRKLFAVIFSPSLSRRGLHDIKKHTCKENYESFVSHEALEELHRFIFVMAVTHIAYSCITMLLAIAKIHSWRKWENEARRDAYGSLTDTETEKTLQMQSTFVRVYTSSPSNRRSLLIWLICFIRQGRSVVRHDYLTLRKGFIANHHLISTYDFHSYLIRCMEDEFQSVSGVSGPLWGFVVAFMLFNVKGSNLYFWIALIPITVVLTIDTKLLHIIATLVVESGLSPEAKLKPRDELFWFKKPEILLSLIHFILFQNAFELASFLWFWWEFGFCSCYIQNHTLLFVRLTLGFAGQFLCSYSTLPLYALVTQMRSNYKAALIPQRIRETLYGWGESARTKRRRQSCIHVDDSTIQTRKGTVMPLEYDNLSLVSPSQIPHTAFAKTLQSSSIVTRDPFSVGTPLRNPYASTSPSNLPRIMLEEYERSASSTMPARRFERSSSSMHAGGYSIEVERRWPM